MKTLRSRSPDELADAFVDLIEEGRGLLGEITGKPVKSSTLRDALDDVSRKIATFQSSATRAAQVGAEQTTRAAKRADRYVRDNPWPAVAGGIVLGVLAASVWLGQRR